ncbi:hypothetical protein PTKIN_Ptkin02bG0087500 [Pterospermum kingtungense]
MSWADSLGYRHVVFKTDAKSVVDAIFSPNVDNSEIGDLVAICKSFLDKDNDFSLCFTRRQANKVAHTLAKASCSYVSPTIWHVLPDFIAYVVLNNCYGFEDE